LLTELQLKSNGGILHLKCVVDFPGVDHDVWFNDKEKCLTNILAMALVKKEYDITNNNNAFIVHQAKKGYPEMVFVPQKSGLHVYNPEEKVLQVMYSLRQLRKICLSLPSSRSRALMMPATFK
jgi:hypothetical protein